MKKLALFLTVALSLMASVAPFATTKDISKIDEKNSLWKKATASKLGLYPQMTVEAIDIAAEATQGAKPLEASVQAIKSGTHLAIKISWQDSTHSTSQGTNRYPDGVAVQFPADASKPLPYIGMGDPRSPAVVFIRKSIDAYSDPKDFKANLDTQSVNLYGDDLAKYTKTDKASKKVVAKPYQKSFISEGFRTMTESATDFVTSMSYKKGGYEAVFVVPLKSDMTNLDRALIPLAVAVWDGDKAGRDGAKWLSRWQAIVVDQASADQALLTDLTAEIKGNVENGKEQASMFCAACHTFGEFVNPMPTMAPNLHWFGNQTTRAYFKESLADPSAVIVPGYNKYAHPNTQWHMDAGDMKMSTMPPFDLPDEIVDDMLAYFRSIN